jgi:hypothetical protein
LPLNGVFAEDYFSREKNEYAYVYSVKILRLTEHETLNEMERRLIALYEANITGYNKTKGNCT